jgi:hypothetical protein
MSQEIGCAVSSAADTAAPIHDLALLVRPGLENSGHESRRLAQPMSPGCVGCPPGSSRVSALEAGLSSARRRANYVKCWAESLGSSTPWGRRDAVRSPRRCRGSVLSRSQSRAASTTQRVSRQKRGSPSFGSRSNAGSMRRLVRPATAHSRVVR